MAIFDHKKVEDEKSLKVSVLFVKIDTEVTSRNQRPKGLASCTRLDNCEITVKNQ